MNAVHLQTIVVSMPLVLIQRGRLTALAPKDIAEMDTIVKVFLYIFIFLL